MRPFTKEEHRVVIVRQVESGWQVSCEWTDDVSLVPNEAMARAIGRILADRLHAELIVW